MAQNSKVPDPELVDKEIKVLQARRQGYTFHDIAQLVGYADASGAYLAYKRAIKRTMQQPADELRQQELDRIDRLQRALWQQAIDGDVKSVLAIAKLMERRAKLTGLDMPVKIEQEVTTWNGEESIDRAVRELAALLNSNTSDSASASAVAEQISETDSVAARNGLGELDYPLGSWVGENEDGSGVDSLGSPQES